VDRFAALEAFVAVYESGSFSAASRRLHVGQPAVSKLVAGLEMSLGTRLVLRSTRGLTPTEAGQHYYAHARRALDAAEEAVVAARGSRGELSGRLRITVAPAFARLHVVPYLKGFLDRHPGLSIDVLMDDRHTDLLGEGIDVALRIGTSLAESNMTAKSLLRSPRVVVGTPTYFAAAGEPKRPADLIAHEAVLFDIQPLSGQWTFTRASTQVSVDLRGRLRFGAAEGVRAAVLSHAGLTIATAWMFKPELADGTVRAVLRDWKLPPAELWAVFPAGRMASTKARAFVAYLEEILHSLPE
jgi:DNA-binding transcriptional LysR family regulator